MPKVTMKRRKLKEDNIQWSVNSYAFVFLDKNGVRPADRQTDKETETERQTERQTDRQTEKGLVISDLAINAHRERERREGGGG